MSYAFVGARRTSFFLLAFVLAEFGSIEAQKTQVSDEPERSFTWPVPARKISNRTSGFADALDPFDHFGWSAARLGDLDGDGTVELAIGAPGDRRDRNDGDGPRGGVWVISLDAQGIVRATHKIACDDTDPSVGAFFHDFGSGVASPGDLDGDGTPELVVGSSGDDDGGSDRGAVYVLFLTREGKVRQRQKISQTSGNFAGSLRDLDRFGSSVAGLGDLDGDGVDDLAVGAFGDDDGNSDTGAVWILFLNTDGTVRTSVKHSQTNGALAGQLQPSSWFGSDLAGLGDLDADGIPDLAVGNLFDDGGSLNEGAIWILFLRADGAVRASQKISEIAGGFAGTLPSGAFFGSSLARLGDIDGNGSLELAVGAPGVSSNRGSFWVLSVDVDGTVLGQQSIQPGQGGFTGPLDQNDLFGEALAALGDLDGDGQIELCVGAPDTTTAGDLRGSAWVLSLTSAGTVAAEHRLREGESGFPLGTLEENNAFGHALTGLGDLDDDGVGDIAVGTVAHDYSSEQGVWVLRLKSGGAVAGYQEIDAGVGGMPASALTGFFDFGQALACPGDLDGDGIEDLVTSALEVGGGGVNAQLGTIFVLFLEQDGSVREHRAVQPPRALITERDQVGHGLCALGDLDGDGVVDLLAGAPGDDDGGTDRGALWVLFLNADGTLRDARKISALEGGFTGMPPNSAEFGSAVAALGDFDGDGVVDAAVGAPLEDDGGTDWGAVYLLFLQPDGTVRGHAKISASQGLSGLSNGTRFGTSLAGLGDLDGNGVPDLAVGGRGLTHDQLRVLRLRSGGVVIGLELIPPAPGRFAGTLDRFDSFGASVAALGDLDGDGVVDLGVGAPGDDDGGSEHGAVWLVRSRGVACLDFSKGDDAARTPLANGASVATPDGFGRTLEISASGANLGPALYETSVGGPNDPGPAPALLVGLGNALVLQDSLQPTQGVPGVFDQPDDDPDGGTLRFQFRRGAVEPLHLDLIAQGAGSGGASVVLVDGSGRTRTYSIPSGWTEDLSVDGGQGYRTLDLTRLDPQPGFQATATASEMPGFLSRSVVRIEVTLVSSGALDNLCWRPLLGG